MFAIYLRDWKAGWGGVGRGGGGHETQSLQLPVRDRNQGPRNESQQDKDCLLPPSQIIRQMSVNLTTALT